MADTDEIITKTVHKARKREKRVEKRMSRASVKAEKRGHILRMLEVPPADPDKPKGDKPSGVRMLLRAFRPSMLPGQITSVPQANDKAMGSSQTGGTTSGGADSAAIYEVHMPDHGDAKVYGITPKKAFTKAMKYMATYSKMLAEMMPGGQGAASRDQGKPPKKIPEEKEGLQVVNLGKSLEDIELQLKP